ncbi:MAG: pectate lyase [Rubripirellula sp.]
MVVARSLLFLIAVSNFGVVQAETLSDEASSTLRKAAEYYRGTVSRNGGYVYHYSPDLTQRWGEGVATAEQIWVQPPGTPTVGLAFLKAYETTHDSMYLDAATDAAVAIAYGQLKSGGWTNAIDFDPKGAGTAEYRNGRGGGKNNSSLDDGQSQSAIQLLVRVDGALETKNRIVHEASVIGLDALLRAQFPNGGFPQVWTGPVERHPIKKANFPEHDWRTEGRIKNYWDMYTINDNVTGYVADTLIAAHETYGEPRYMEALKKLGDFLLLAQLPEPQPGWAQQYNYEMQPIWARRFEPPGVSGDETQEVISTLMTIAHVTGDKKYLEPVPSAAAWLRRSALPSGEFARYYELQTNRPLYMSRSGKQYSLTYDDSRLPDHYGWKTPSQLEILGKKFELIRAGKPPVLPVSEREQVQAARNAIASLDSQGRWISTFDGEKLIGQLKLPIGTQYIASQVFADNVAALCNVISTAP